MALWVQDATLVDGTGADRTGRGAARAGREGRASRTDARRWVVAAAAVTALSACGSTVQQSSVATLGGNLDGGGAGTGQPLEVPTSAVGGGDRAVLGTTQQVGGAAQASQGGSTTGTTGGAVGGTTGLPVGASGRGFTATTIYLGVADIDVNSYAKTLGINGVATGNIKAQAAAVIGDINKHGGLLGRQIKLVWFNASTAEELNDPQTSHQAACAAWTQDNHVFAVVGPFGTGVDDILLACLARSGTPVVGAANPWGLDTAPFFQPTFDKFPGFVNIGAMLGERFYRVAVNRLVQRGFFQGWNTATGEPGPAPLKLGVVVQDTPNGNLELKAIVSNLARYGIKPTDVVKLSGDLSTRSAQGQNAVLRFRGDGITHIINPTGMNTADAQHYYPRYFIPNEPQLVGANVPASQLKGSMGESYLPAVDVGEQPAKLSAAATQCLNLMRAAGEQPAWGSVDFIMESVCDGFYGLQHAVQQAGVLSTPGLVAGFDALGARWQAAATWTTFLGRGQHASAQALRDLAYVVSCKCFRYASAQDWS